MDQDDLDPHTILLELLGLALDRLDRGQELQPFGRARLHELGRVLQLDADHSDLEPLVGEDSRSLHPVGVLQRVLVDDIGAEEREVRTRLLALQSIDAVVELVVAVRGRVETPRVLHVDRRHVLEQPRVRRRRADVVTGGQEQRALGQLSSLLVEHRRQLGRAADGHVASVDRQRRRLELTVEVGEPDEGHERSIVLRHEAGRAAPRPCECCGSGTPSRYAMVGARSIVRSPFATTSERISPPPAMKVARMFTLAPRFWTSGT